MSANPRNSSAAPFSTSLDIAQIRRDFPALAQKVHQKPLVYFDNAATSQKPMSVIETVSRFYAEDCSNIHRGVHTLSERATRHYEESREKIRRFINAKESREIIFVRGATEGINLVASSYGRMNVGRNDEILVSALEHHSNIVPWQMLCEEKGAKLVIIPMNDNGELEMSEYERLLTGRTKLVAVAHVSNALGSINPIEDIIAGAHRRKIPVLIDGAQAVPHAKVDVSRLDCDFYVFSSHKMYGPTGVGVLYGKAALLEKMPPYQGGGDMISSVTFERTTYNGLPYKFEAGTPHIAGGIGMGAAVDYLEKLGLENIAHYENELLEYATSKLESIPGIRLIGTAAKKAAVLSFLVGDIHPHDVGSLLDEEGIAIRTGHHCAQPVMDRFQIAATCRASFSFYNTKAEIDKLVEAIYRVKGVFEK